MRGLERVGLLALLALGVACRGALPGVPLPEGDPRPAALLAAWVASAGAREALRADARLAVDAPGAGDGGRDLSLRSRQRLLLERPAALRVEVLGFLDATVAVLATDGRAYELFQVEGRHFERGSVYPELLWDAARLDLSPSEAVEVILGIPDPAAGLTPARASERGEIVSVELEDGEGRLQRVVDFGPGGELIGLRHFDADGRMAWRADFSDWLEFGGAPFAREIELSSGEGRAQARLRLRRIEVNPEIDAGSFTLDLPEFGARDVGRP